MGITTQGNTQTVTVNTLDDQTDGICSAEHCSLREAVLVVNEGRATKIQFDKSLSDTLWLNAPLPDLTAPNSSIQGDRDQGMVISTKVEVDYGIKISATQVIISGLIFNGFKQFGIQLDSLAELVFLHSNQFNYNGVAGLYAKGAKNINIGQIDLPNRFIGNKKAGISLDYTNGSSLIAVVGNELAHNPTGILGIQLTIGSYLGNNIIEGGSQEGITLIRSEGVRIFYNEIKGHIQQGILLDQSNNITVQENLLINHPIGIMQQDNGRGNRYTQNQFTCTAQPIVRKNNNQALSNPDQICYDGQISGFSPPFSRVEVYSLKEDTCGDGDRYSWSYIGETQSEQRGWWEFEVVDSTVQQVSAIALDALGNTSEFAPPVSLIAYPSVNLQVDSNICSGDSIIIAAVIDSAIIAQFDFFWMGFPGFKQNGLMIQEVLSSGWYSFMVTKDYCSKVLDSVFVQQKDLDTIRIGPSYGPLCYGTEIEIGGIIYNANNARQTIIRGGNDGGCDTIVEIDLDFLEASISYMNPSICRSDTFIFGSELFFEGRERDTILLPNGAQNGCDSLVIIEVDIIDNPVRRIHRDLCIDDFEIINGVQYDKNHTEGYFWISGGNLNCDTLVEISFDFHRPRYDTIKGTYCEGSQFNINGVIYDVQNPKGVEYLTNKYGCDSVIYVDLTFDFNTIYYLDTILCDDETLVINGNVYDQNHTSGVEQFIAGGDVNCDSIIYIEITYTERQGAVTLSPLLTVEQGGTITIDPLITFDPASISWVSNLDLSCFDCMAPMVFGDQSGWLKLVVTDINGCNYEATAQLEIKGIRTEFAFIPNAFSPNGDGINDVFEVFPDYNWATEVRHLKIVDRWGRVVYSSEQNKWDGTTNGSLALPGVYIYAVELIMKDGTVSNQQGSVFLYR